MPVDVSGIHPIIQAFLESMAQGRAEAEKKLDREQQSKLQAERLKSQENEFNQRMQLLKQQFDLEKQQREISHKKMMFDVESELRRQFRTGERVPSTEGALTLPTTVPKQGPAFEDQTQAIPLETQPLRTQTTDTPFGPMTLSNLQFQPDVAKAQAQNLDIVTPAIARQHGAIKTAEVQAEMPAVEAKGKQQLFQELLKNYLNEERDSKKFAAQDAITQKRLDSMERNTDARVAGMLEGIDRRLAAQGKQNELPPTTLTNTVNGLINGDTTLEDLAKKGFKPEQRVQITSALEAQGYRALTNADRTGLQGLADVATLHDAYQKLAKVYAKYGMNVVKAKADKEAIALNNIIDATLPRMARTFGGDRGAISNKDAERAGALRPSVLNIFGQNQASINEVKSILEKGIDKYTNGMAPDQEMKIRRRLGLPTDNFINLNGETVKSEQRIR